MIQQPQIELDCSRIDFLLDKRKYDEAIAIVTLRLERNPQDRETQLYWLLVNATLHGPESHE